MHKKRPLGSPGWREAMRSGRPGWAQAVTGGLDPQQVHAQRAPEVTTSQFDPEGP